MAVVRIPFEKKKIPRISSIIFSYSTTFVNGPTSDLKIFEKFSKFSRTWSFSLFHQVSFFKLNPLFSSSEIDRVAISSILMCHMSTFTHWNPLFYQTCCSSDCYGGAQDRCPSAHFMVPMKILIFAPNSTLIPFLNSAKRSKYNFGTLRGLLDL